MSGLVTVAGIPLRESRSAEQNATTVNIVGRQSYTHTTAAQVKAAHDNLVQLPGLVVPVVFEDKEQLTGFYRVDDVASSLDWIAQGAIQQATWRLTLSRVGGAKDVEVESRVPTVARTTTVSSPPTAVFWHAPPAGSSSYFTGPTVPTSSITRTSADGDMTVHLGIPAGFSPRWTSRAQDYLAGGARLLFDGIRRIGEHTPPLVVWQVDNGLVKIISGSSGSFTVSCWDSGDWRSAKSYKLLVNGVAQTGTPEFTVLRNAPEEVAVRLTYPASPGRLTVDLSLRRGARFVTGVIKRHSSATLRLERTAAESATAVTGGLKATSADADGNRFVMGSAVTVTTALATAAIEKASVLSLDFFVGHEVNASPQSGDAFADLWAQYRGSTGERTRVVLR